MQQLSTPICKNHNRNHILSKNADHKMVEFLKLLINSDFATQQLATFYLKKIFAKSSVFYENYTIGIFQWFHFPNCPWHYRHYYEANKLKMKIDTLYAVIDKDYRVFSSRLWFSTVTDCNRLTNLLPNVPWIWPVVIIWT